MVVVLGVLGLWVITAGESRHPAPSSVLDPPRIQSVDPEQSELRPADVDFGSARTR
jgi:hypothetical protein